MTATSFYFSKKHEESLIDSQTGGFWFLLLAAHGKGRVMVCIFYSLWCQLDGRVTLKKKRTIHHEDPSLRTLPMDTNLLHLGKELEMQHVSISWGSGVLL